MPSSRLPRRTPSRYSAVVLPAMLMVATVVLVACSGDKANVSKSDITTPPSAGGFNRPAPTVPANCPPQSGPVARLTVDENGITPRCLVATTQQKLQIKNNGTSFHNIQIEDLNANLSPKDTQYFDQLGKYLSPGTYLIWSWTEADPSVFPNFNGTLVLKAS